MMNLFSKRLNSEKEIDEEHDMHMNSSEIHISDIEQSLTNWSIPKQNPNTIYKIGTFDFLQSYSIKTNEQTISINKDYEKINLLSEKSIILHRQKYKFMHIGLVQVAVKPLFRLGIDAPVLLVLRDARHKNFQNSILAMAETNISNGPIYFNCYPNFSIGLFDPNILDTLVLTIKTKNLEFTVDTKAIAVIYRVCYKTMTTTIEPRAKIGNTKDYTLMIESNPMSTRVSIPKKLRWDEITKSCNWNLQDIGTSKPSEDLSQISNIVEHTDGSVDINFENFDSSQSVSSRYAASCSNSTIKLGNLDKLKSKSLKYVDFDQTIPKTYYQEDNKSNISDGNYSPTRSDFLSETDRLKNQI